MKSFINNVILGAACIVHLYSCSPKKNFSKVQTPTKHSRKQDSLAFELCQMYGADQMTRNSKGFKDKWELLIWPTDSTLFEKFSNMVKVHGYPNKKNIGEKNMFNECVSSAGTAILLHSPHRLINEQHYLDLYLKEVKAGRMKMDLILAVLDKPRFFKKDEDGHPSMLYSTTWGKLCLKNRKESDSVRLDLGLPPLKFEDFIICE